MTFDEAFPVELRGGKVHSVRVWPFSEFLQELRAEVLWSFGLPHIARSNGFTDALLSLAEKRVRQSGRQPR